MGSRRYFINTSSQSSLLFRRLSAPNSCLRRPISSQKYSNGKESDQERAPSTLEEFKRLSEEKDVEMERQTTEAKVRQGHGFGSQTEEKAKEEASATPKMKIVKQQYSNKEFVGEAGRTGTGTGDDDS